jgi:hypothetical protein
MSSELDIDDAVADHPQAKQELKRLRDALRYMREAYVALAGPLLRTERRCVGGAHGQIVGHERWRVSTIWTGYELTRIEQEYRRVLNDNTHTPACGVHDDGICDCSYEEAE